MKKLLLLSAIAFAAVSANAQITVTADGEPVANGGTVNSSRMKIDISEQEVFGIVVTSTNYKLDPDIMVSGEGSYYVRVLDTTTDHIEGMPTLQICWPMLCVDMINGEFATTGVGEFSKDPSLHLYSTSGYVTDWDMDPGEYWPEAFTLSCKVEIIPANSSNPVFTFNCNMIYDPSIWAGVNDITVDSDAPVVYYDLTGRQVLNPVKGQIVIERQGSKVRKVVK